jgi:hypothetical protein
MSVSSDSAVRRFVFAFAGVLAMLAMWMSISEFLRPPFAGFPTDAAIAQAASRYRANSILAARIGLVRGDLWTASDITYAGLFWPSRHNGDRGSVEPLLAARGLAERALRFSPHDARAWLLLASFELRAGAPGSEVLAALKMSYYTGPYETGLIPLRLLVATGLESPGDEEMRDLITRDIRSILTQRSDLRGTISLAYRDSAPYGRNLIEAALDDLDPTLLASLRSANPGKSDQNK